MREANTSKESEAPKERTTAKKENWILEQTRREIDVKENTKEAERLSERKGNELAYGMTKHTSE